MKFNQYIAGLISSSGMTRKQILEVCHESNDSELQSTDAITLSRWINGKTVPSLYKQILLVKLLRGSLQDFLKSIQLTDIKDNSKEESFFNNYARLIDNNHNSINYLSRSNEKHVEIKTEPINDVLNKLSAFHNNFSSFNSFLESTKIIYKSNASLITYYESGKPVGHIAFIEINKITFKKNVFTDAILFFPVYYCDSNILKELMANFFITLLDAPWNNYKYALGLTMPGARLDFHNLFGDAESLAFYPPNENHKVGAFDKGLFFIKINLLKYYSKKVIVKEIIQRL